MADDDEARRGRRIRRASARVAAQLKASAEARAHFEDWGRPDWGVLDTAESRRQARVLTAAYPDDDDSNWWLDRARRRSTSSIATSPEKKLSS